jgi:cell division protein ZapA (FtsZ GTPase activity inhibitor)
VDEMINSIHAKIPEQPALTVAVLSALNITEDLLRERDRAQRTSAHVEEEVSKMTHFLEKHLRDV